MLQSYFFYDLFLWWYSFVLSLPVSKTPNSNTAHLPTEKLNIYRHYTVVVVTPILPFLFCFGRRRAKLDSCLISHLISKCSLYKWVKGTVDETKLDSVISYLDYVYPWNMMYWVNLRMCLHWLKLLILGYHLRFRRVLWYHYLWTYFLLLGLTPASFHITVVSFHFSLSLIYLIQCKIYTEACVICFDSPFSHYP